MSVTRTGNFPIGFRRGWSDWQKSLAGLIEWAKQSGFAGLDVGSVPEAEIQQIQSAGLRIGSVDLPQPWGGLGSADAGKRKDTAAQLADYVNRVAALGVRNIFCVMFPDDHAKKRADNLELLSDGYNQLCSAIERSGARLVLEGYPGGGPHYAALGCTPADLRLLFERIPSKAMGVNFDPSHLIRMGIDPVRFAREFAPRIFHMHGKDTELLDEGLYDHGNLQPATLAKARGFGAHAWRYTLPGHGVAPWTTLLAILNDAGYAGMISVELEDEHFNGTEDGEKRGLLASLQYLSNA